MEINASVAGGVGTAACRVEGNGSGNQIFVTPLGSSINVSFVGDATGDPSDPTTPALILQNGDASVSRTGDVSSNGGAIDAEDPNISIQIYDVEIIGNSADANGGGEVGPPSDQDGNTRRFASLADIGSAQTSY